MQCTCAKFTISARKRDIANLKSDGFLSSKILSGNNRKNTKNNSIKAFKFKSCYHKESYYEQ